VVTTSQSGQHSSKFLLQDSDMPQIRSGQALTVQGIAMNGTPVFDGFHGNTCLRSR
jgi:hypothetical protein